MPAVSVVMPVRNAAAYLAEAIDSVLEQTLADLELVVVDDGSRDGSAAILAQAQADPRVRVLRSGGSGIVPALNAGITAARADLIARMDADDVALPTRLATQIEALRANPTVAVIGSACEIIDGAGRLLRQQAYPASPEAIRKALERGNCLAHPTVLMRKDAVVAVGGYRAHFACCEDYDLWLRLSERHDLLNLHDPLVRYRVHPGQSTWVDHEQRILSELAALACARARRGGRSEPRLTDGPADRALLRAAGMTEVEIAREIAGRSRAAALDAAAMGLPLAAIGAILLAITQPGLGPRWRLAAVKDLGSCMLSRPA